MHTVDLFSVQININQRKRSLCHHFRGICHFFSEDFGCTKDSRRKNKHQNYDPYQYFLHLHFPFFFSQTSKQRINTKKFLTGI